MLLHSSKILDQEYLQQNDERAHVAGKGLNSELLGEDDSPFPSIAGMTIKYFSGLSDLCLVLMSHSLSAMEPENLHERGRKTSAAPSAVQERGGRPCWVADYRVRGIAECLVGEEGVRDGLAGLWEMERRGEQRRAEQAKRRLTWVTKSPSS